MKANSKLQQQIFVIAAILTVFVVLLLGLAISVVVYKQGVENAETVIRNKNSTVATLIQGYFAPLHKALAFAGEEVATQHRWPDPEEGKQTILNLYSILQNTTPNIHFIFSGYEDGSLLINNYSPPAGYNAVERPWYQAALETHPETSKGVPYQEVLSEEWLVSLSQTLVSDDDQLLGVVAIDASIDAVIQALALQDRDYPTAYSFVLDQQGRTLIHNNPALHGSFHKAAFENLPSPAIQSGNFTYNDAGTQSIAHFNRVEDLGWIIVTGVHRADVLKPIKVRIFSSLAIIIAAALVATWLASFLLSRNIINPLIQLQKRLEDIVAGSSQASADQQLPNNELGRIAESIESLTKDALYQKNLALEAKNSLLNHLSKTDQLTGIANRRKIQEALEQEVERFLRDQLPFSIVLFDIDHFKKINDHHGHDTGDQVLAELARQIKSRIRRRDVFGRWGGEEFILLFPETSHAEASQIAEQLRSQIAQQTFTKNLHVTLSCGVSEFQGDLSLQEVLIEVDKKMYQAKEQGRNRVQA